MTTPRDVKRSWLDRVTFAIVTRGWEAKYVDDYRQRLRRNAQVMSADAMEAIEQIADKATSLLSHV